MDEKNELSENETAFNTAQNAIDRLKDGEYPSGNPLPIIEKTPEEQKKFVLAFTDRFYFRLGGK